MNFVLNSSLGASCGDFGNLGRFADSPVQSHAPNFQKTPQPPPQILEFEDLKNADSANQTQIAESRLDSTDSQNLVILNPCEAPKTKFLLLFAFAKRRVPLYLVIARKSVGFSWQSIKQ